MKNLSLNVNWNYALTHADDIMKEEFPLEREAWLEACREQLEVSDDKKK